ncbi:helix-turn-helix domain-containing protein [Actinokineospora sp. HUAS TT18]|uniref:helix-turn-helix domain-containing protein n=1 Tax=Actinokineospora sp. HUAS TT18 TaxID=3447451 RepID=UPI003F51D753
MIRDRQPARMRALGKELVDARKRAGKTGRQVKAATGLSLATLSRNENGLRAPSVLNVATLLAVYGVIGAERDRLLDMAAKVHDPTWLEAANDQRIPRLLPALCGFESEASLIVHFAPFMVPGLMQTPAYLRSAMTLSTIPGHEERIEARLRRQSILNKIVPPHYVALIDEAALRRPFGGAEVMVQQLNWLIGRAQQPNITIRVIPFRHGGYINHGMYALMEFRDAPPVIYVEGEATGFLDGPQATPKFRTRTADLERIALGQADSVNFLMRMVADYERS